MESPFDCILFDLDDTLYPSSLGISQVCKQNIEDYLAQKCGVTAERAASLRVELFQSFGSSLAGLIALGYSVHPDEYHSLVHGTLPYDRIGQDPQLRERLLSIKQTKMIFTNSDKNHVSKVLEKLGIEEEIFDGIVCFETLNHHLFQTITTTASVEVILKPSLAAMETAVRISGSDSRRILFLDDNHRNIAAGKAIGLYTGLVGKKKTKEADYLVEGINCLKYVIPEIWAGKEGKERGEQVMAEGSHLNSFKSSTAERMI